MSLSTIKKTIIRNGVSLISKSSSRKFIVIESDDWGSIRMPSNDVFKFLVKKGVPIQNNPFNKFDTLASEQDLIFLFELLSSIKDNYGNSPAITANTVVANPDFKKIKESNYQNYFFEPFPETLQKYPNHAKSFDVWKQGVESKVFKPQFHGREHLNVNCWMNLLQKKDPNFILAFENGVFGITTKNKIARRNDCLASFDLYEIEDELNHKEIIESGIALFNDVFNFSPKSFIAPTYVWSKKIESFLHENQIRYIQGFNFQLIPNLNKVKYQKKFHYTGQQNKFKQTYLVRNAFFEPTLYKLNWEEEILKRAEIAFRWKTPLIIGSHRVNFIGDLFPKNRDENLRLFGKVLKSILKKYPDVEFVTSDILGDVFSQPHNKI